MGWHSATVTCLDRRSNVVGRASTFLLVSFGRPSCQRRSFFLRFFSLRLHPIHVQLLCPFYVFIDAASPDRRLFARHVESRPDQDHHRSVQKHQAVLSKMAEIALYRVRRQQPSGAGAGSRRAVLLERKCAIVASLTRKHSLGLHLCRSSVKKFAGALNSKQHTKA